MFFIVLKIVKKLGLKRLKMTLRVVMAKSKIYWIDFYCIMYKKQYIIIVVVYSLILI